MRTNNRYPLLFMLSLIFSIFTSVKAQEVVWHNGQLVIDNSALPPSALYDDGKSVETTQDPVWTDEFNPKNRVSKKFAVALTDITGDTRIGKDNVKYTPCNYLGDGWRVPNQRELMLMWVLRESLIYVANKNGYPSFSFADSDGYWSSTEYSASTSHAWRVNFSAYTKRSYGGRTDEYSKTESRFNVRCVLGITD